MKTTKVAYRNLEPLERVIFGIRGQRVMLDVELAWLYGVSTKRLNKQVKSNRKRLPAHFMFQPTEAEKVELLADCNNVRKLNFSPGPAYAWTEPVATMATSVLNSDCAIHASVYGAETFVPVRKALLASQGLAHKLVALEEELKKALGCARSRHRGHPPTRDGYH